MNGGKLIYLHVTVMHNYCTVYSPQSDPDRAIQIAAEGAFPQDYFPGMKIECVSDCEIVVSLGSDERRILTLGDSVIFFCGDSVECYDGSVMGDTFSCKIEWPK